MKTGKHIHTEQSNEDLLKIFSDGGARGNPGKSSCAFVVFKNNKNIYEKSKFLGYQTNNFSEYSAVLLAMTWLKKYLKKIVVSKIIFYLDSELVVNQLIGAYKIKNLALKALYLKIKIIEQSLKVNINFIAIPRRKNKRADFLVNKELDEN
jgi:ribonuclease HI